MSSGTAGRSQTRGSKPPKPEAELSQGSQAAKATEFNRLNSLGSFVRWRWGMASGEGITVGFAFLFHGFARVQLAGRPRPIPLDAIISTGGEFDHDADE